MTSAAMAVFPCGVASGEPGPHGIVLWTCLGPGAVDGGTDVPVGYEIAADPGFRDVRVRGEAATHAGRDWTVRVVVDDPALEPFTTYYYRFTAAGATSRPGRFRTLPDPDARPERVRIAFLSCQDYTNGYYTALAHLAREDVDYVLHLGDYIYETTADPSFQSGQVRALRLPGRRIRAQTLADYRYLYRAYKRDPYLQRLHEAFACWHCWDDHEFANDSYGVYDTDTRDERLNYSPARRLAASQAWHEYLPTRLEFTPERGPLDALRVYRSVRIGDLVELVITDERLYRDGPPCGLGTFDRYLTPGCPARLDKRRTILGPVQREWFVETVTRSTRVWKIWANQVMCMQLKLSTDSVRGLFPWLPHLDLYVNLDQWDGFPAERERVLRAIERAGVTDFVVLTGDIHSFGAGYLRADFDDPASPALGVGLIGGSVTSANFVEMLTFGFGGVLVPPEAELTPALVRSNPHLKYFNSAAHGYVVLDITRTGITATMKAVDTIRARAARLLTLREFWVPRGAARLVRTGEGVPEFGTDDPDLSPSAR
ncbi:phosphodiesterase [Carbonactinospora thermoautotrophica]|uniref:alkaline phosphatase D family protein n=1 Tax=Carbonactinospora thermoautotrophica TaxID=1469144 RepID=UPI002270C747|nr:alkaline phosphatase D family protein [Carbonactinospora thermoautotrophica]MCX9192104.1 phosphodiesterase [Carbonactinospora thermoautotrophica]